MSKFARLTNHPRINGAIAVIVLGALLLAFSTTATAQSISDPCADCHNDNYQDWKVSGHPYKLMEAAKAQNRPIPLPYELTWDDISYVIGGYKWKSRYMDEDGWIITNDESAEGGNTQYNNLTGQWSDYHADEANGTKPYDCGRCHTTNWVENPDPTDLSGNQGGLPGIWGTFDDGGIQCIQCHGDDHPGSIPTMDDEVRGCGACHIRGAADTIPASGGFIRHHEQYNEHLAGPHAAFDCVTCHNPHKRGEWSIKDTAQCGVSCHASKMESYKLTSMYDYGVTCEDCHMPFATKSAKALGPVVDGQQTEGDVMTHLYYINTDPLGDMFTDDGGFVDLDSSGKGAVTMNFACQRCHQTASLDELALYAEGFHDTDKGLEDIGLDPGLTGTWWNPAKDGEGFLLEVAYAGGQTFLYASFYTYGPNGEQTWLVAALTSQDGIRANVEIYAPSGGEWGDPSGADTGIVFGTGYFDFPTCEAGSFMFTPNQAFMDMGYTAQGYDLVRILESGISCPTFVNNEMAAMQ